MKKWKDYIWVWCGAVIVNDNNETLLMKRGSECRNQAWYWSRPWWGVDFWETLEEAVIREVREEIWVEAEVVWMLEVSDNIMPEEWQHWIAVSFVCKIKSWEIKNMEPHKCEEIRWFNIYDLPEKIASYTKLWVENYIKKYCKK